MDLAPQGTPGYDYTANIIGGFNGANSAGSALGAVFTVWSADKFGRLRSIQLGALVLIIGAVLCAASVNVAMFMVVGHCLCAFVFVIAKALLRRLESLLEWALGSSSPPSRCTKQRCRHPNLVGSW
jgi:MFS family permease